MYKHFDKKTYCLLIVGLLLLSISLPGCAGTESLDPKLFQYSNTQWNMTVDEVMTALELTEDDCAVLLENSQSLIPTYIFSTNSLKLFGEKATTVFEFRTQAGDEYGLNAVYVLFEPNVNISNICSRIEKQLGPDIDAEVRSDMADASGNIGYWDSSEMMMPYIESAYKTHGVDIPESMNMLYQNMPASRLYWTSDLSHYFDLMNYEFRDLLDNDNGQSMLVFHGHITPVLQNQLHGFQ